MKKEINLYIIGIVFIACLIGVTATVVNNHPEVKTVKINPVKTPKLINTKVIIDWVNVDNPKKKVYLEYLYNSTLE